jgi:alpha-amylase
MKFKQGKNRRFFQVLICTMLLSLTCIIASFADIKSLLNLSTPKVQAAAVTTGADTFSWDNASVYFLLTDRFNNGDTTNDHSYNRGLDQNGNVINYTDTSATFHGGDFAGITDKIEEGYFDDLGISALWISAPYEQIHGYVVGSDSSDSFAHYAYHGYYVLDYTQTDANFGTEEEFQELVDTAHEHGIRVLLDVVMNHTGYNTIYDMAEYNFGTLASGWESTYYKSSGINNTSYHSLIDYTSSATDWANWWGAGWVRCGVAGYDVGGSTNLTMSLAGLPDFKTESTSTVGIPKLLQTKWNMEGRYATETAALSSYLSSHSMAMTPTNVLTYWLQSWVRKYGVDGFRCDTAKHVDLASWATLKTACVEALQDWKAENPSKALDDLDFWMTGEVWDHGVYKDEYYTTGGFDSIINFSTQGGGILAKSTVAATYQSFANSLNTDPDFNVLSYISSHDSVLTRGNSIYMGSAFQLLPGAIQIFYGDETDRPIDSSASTNGDHEVRGDMNWDDMNTDTLAHWQKVGTFRNNHIAVGAGANASLTASDGVAFSRIYDSNGIYDKIAACIGCSSSTNVTIDVSSLWEDGQILTNAYDYTTATVTGGSVTFNSGKNGTILIEEPDGKPLITVTGNARFHGTQEVTLGVTGADYAKVSVDGAKKFLAYDGDTFTIGGTAYEGDTVSVTVEATNAEGTRTSTYTFYKAYADESLTEENDEEHAGILYVKSYDGTAPYVYAWKGTSTALCGAWPGTKMTVLNSEGYYVMDLGTTDTYNVVLNNGSGKQSGNITGLEGSVWVDITSSSYAYNIVAREVEMETTPITFYVHSYTGAAPYLYIWDAAGNNYNGSFPGKALTQTTSDGWYTITVDSYSSSVNCIVSYGSNTNQSDNITGITNEAWITITSADCKTYDIVKTTVAESYYDTLKKETRKVKNLTAENYTASSYAALYAYVEPADALIALGKENADEAAVQAMVLAIQAAQANLVVAAPTVSGVETGSTLIYGTAAYASKVTVTVGSYVYTTVANDITGEFYVIVNALASTDTVTIVCTLGNNVSEPSTYDLDNSGGEDPEDVEVTSITLNKSSVTIAQGATATLTATVLPSNATDQTVTWTTSNSSVASVAEGVVTGVAEGTAVITATASNGLKATATVTVEAVEEDIEVTSITLDKSSVTIVQGATAALTATVLPSDATNRTVTWTTSNSTVATVSNGVVTGVTKGTAVITATTANGLTATATITVTEAAKTYMYFKKPSTWGTTIYAYIWNDSITYIKTKWPGTAMTLLSDGVYAIQWPEDYTGTDLNVIFDDGSHQTADLDAVKNGYYTSSGYSYTVTAEQINATSVALSQSTAAIEVGATLTLTATVSPSTAATFITWSTSNSAVATISNGVITGVAEGTAVITATTANGLTATVTVTVTVPANTYMYFTKPSSWGSTIYAYIWTSDGTYKNANWPGVVTTLQSNGTYAILYPKGHTGLKIIFTDGSRQTADLDAIEGHTYSVN